MSIELIDNRIIEHVSFMTVKCIVNKRSSIGLGIWNQLYIIDVHITKHIVGIFFCSPCFIVKCYPLCLLLNEFFPVADKPSRTVEDILREVEELQQSAQRGSESRGFQLEQASHLHTGKFSNLTTNCQREWERETERERGRESFTKLS